MKAKRVDLVLVVAVTREPTRNEHSGTRTACRFGTATSVSRDGVVLKVRTVDSNMDRRLWAYETVLVVPKAEVDVEGALAVARSHTWPQHDSPMPYSSVGDARDAIRHLRKTPVG